MNAAARLVHQSTLSRHLLFTYLLTRRQMGLFVLALSILLSALSIIYVTHTARIVYTNYQHLLLEKDRLHVQQGQLLLERSTWMMQSRIQQAAENQLNMVFPDQKSVVIIHE